MLSPDSDGPPEFGAPADKNSVPNGKGGSSPLSRTLAFPGKIQAPEAAAVAAGARQRASAATDKGPALEDSTAARQPARARPQPSLKRSNLWERYKDANKKHPLPTKCITTGVLMGTGNVLGQLIIMAKGKQKRFLSKKLAAFIVFGVFFSGPLGHWWLKFLNGHRVRLKGQALILYKIALDRFLYGPAFNFIMMAFVFKVSGQSWGQALRSMRATFWNAQVLNWKMWPIAQYVNFNYIPAELQLLYMNVIAL